MPSGNLTCFHRVIKSVVFHPSPDVPDTTTILQKFCLYFLKLLVYSAQEMTVPCSGIVRCLVLLLVGDHLQVSDFHQRQGQVTTSSGLLLPFLQVFH